MLHETGREAREGRKKKERPQSLIVTPQIPECEGDNSFFKERHRRKMRLVII